MKQHYLTVEQARELLGLSRRAAFGVRLDRSHYERGVEAQAFTEIPLLLERLERLGDQESPSLPAARGSDKWKIVDEILEQSLALRTTP